MSARVSFYLSEEECRDLGFDGEDVRDCQDDLDYAIKGAYTMDSSVHVVYWFSRGFDFCVIVRAEGLDEDDVKRTVRELARRVFAGEIE